MPSSQTLQTFELTSTLEDLLKAVGGSRRIQLTVRAGSPRYVHESARPLLSVLGEMVAAAAERHDAIKVNVEPTLAGNHLNIRVEGTDPGSGHPTVILPTWSLTAQAHGGRAGSDTSSLATTNHWFSAIWPQAGTSWERYTIRRDLDASRPLDSSPTADRAGMLVH